MSKAKQKLRGRALDRAAVQHTRRPQAHRLTNCRVDELLRLATKETQFDGSDREAALFYRIANRKGRAETKAYAAASKRSITRGED